MSKAPKVDERLPHNYEAEQAVIGGLLIDPDAMFGMDRLIPRPKGFMDTRHQHIYTSIQKLFEEKKQHQDFVVLCDHLERSGKLTEIGGAAYLTELISKTPTSQNVRHYAEIVSKAASLRQMIWAAGQQAKVAQDAWADPNMSISDVQGRCQSILFNASKERTDRNAPSNMAHMMEETSAYLDWRFKFLDQIAGIATGLNYLDDQMDGLPFAQMTVMAARPGSGKTALAMQLAEVAASAGHHPLVFSIEMSERQLGLRYLARAGGFNLQSLRKAKLTDSEWARTIEVQGLLSGLPIWFDYNPAPSISYIRNTYRILNMEYGIDFVIVDHMGLVSTSDLGRAGQNEVQALGHISRDFHSLAKEEGFAFLVLHQLNRKTEGRDDKRPTLDTLRGSGKIEENADNVLFLYNDSMYHKPVLKDDDSTMIEIICDKQRDGPTFTTAVRFDKRNGRFDNAIETFNEMYDL